MCQWLHELNVNTQRSDSQNNWIPQETDPYFMALPLSSFDSTNHLSKTAENLMLPFSVDSNPETQSLPYSFSSDDSDTIIPLPESVISRNQVTFEPALFELPTSTDEDIFSSNSSSFWNLPESSFHF